MAIVLTNGLATLRELQTIYSYGDLLDLAEVAMTNAYNEWAAYKSAEEDRR